MKRVLGWLLVLSGVAVGQSESRVSSAYPHPYVEVGAALNGCGYTTFSGDAAAGLDWEARSFLWKAVADYDTAKKHNDATIDNEKGHLVGLGSNAFKKLPRGWFAGVGGSWGKTITTNYTKSAWYPKLGVGKDFRSARLQFMYFRERNEVTHYPVLSRFTPGPGQLQTSYSCHCGSGVGGIESQLWLPSPASAHHLFFHAAMQIYWFHTSLTDPYNTFLTRAQSSVHDFSGSLVYSAMYRF